VTDSSLDTLDPALREILDRIPPDPGVYLMKDKKGKIIYIGKAASLRARVRSYFTRSGDNRAFVPLLNRLLGDIETVVTNNEKEALLLENNLIKQHQPRFNVKLVDDKNYLVLRLDPTARYPRLEVVRRIGHDQARYFGPYHSATAVRAALKVVNRHFKLRTCTDHVLNTRTRPCLQYQIKRCDAPCVFPVPDAEYADQVRDVTLFLQGKDQELLTRLRTRMKEAATGLEFERAAAVRDQIAALEKTLESQRVVSEDLRDQDVLGFYREGDRVEIAVLHVRLGKLLGRESFSFTDQEFPDDEILSSFVGLYYDLGTTIPDEVLLCCPIEDVQVKAEWLRERRGRKAEVLIPKRGERARLVELANKNAAAAFYSRRNKARDTDELLGKIQQRLGLKHLPRRIECFDISHIQGSYTVASMVVFIDGEPAKGEYRRFKIRMARNDDFASMYEVISRRFRRSVKGQGRSAAAPGRGEQAGTYEALAAAGEGSAPGLALAEPAPPSYGPSPGPSQEIDEEEPADNPRRRGRGAGQERLWPLPDLLVIDGGKGQLGSALAALKDVGVDLGVTSSPLDVVALAKDRETMSGEKQTDRVFLPRIKDPIPLRPNTAELHVLSRIRDEAHRFAITFHGELRRRRTLRSALADVPGIGARRQRELLRHFGSLKKVREASLEELLAVPGMSRPAAEAVRRFFEEGGGSAGEGGGEAGAGELLAPEPQAPPPERLAEAAPQATPRRGRGRPRRQAAEKAGPSRRNNRTDVLEDAAAAELAALLGETSTGDTAAEPEEELLEEAAVRQAAEEGEAERANATAEDPGTEDVETEQDGAETDA
jgi:excinuclease ABC subunit C